MKKVGAYQAKTHLPGLLEEVRRGAKISITRRGVPVAMLVPIASTGKTDPSKTIRDLREFRTGITLGKGSIRELVEEGRKR